MGRIRLLSTAVLLALLVALSLSLPGERGQAGAAEPRTVTGNIMVPAAAFAPTAEDGDFSNNGFVLGAGEFVNLVAPLSFPVQTVNILKMTLYAQDTSAPGDICVRLFYAYPPGGGAAWAGEVCTANNPANPQAVSSTAISPHRVNTAVRGPFLWAMVHPGTGLYGVKITYSYETG
jgi:hypothetical protein